MEKSPACRQEGETKEDCVARKIPEIKEEHPDWADDQVQAVAYSICDEACSDKYMKEKNMAVRSQDQYIRKHIGVPLEKSYAAQEDGSIMVRGYFTSDVIDEVGDIITREATEKAVPKYREWGNIRYMHLPKPVAKVVRIGKEDGLKWNEVEIHVIDPEAVFQVKNGLLKALSVGIVIRSWDDIEINEETGGWEIIAYELVEISLVDHPANYDAKLFLDDDKVLPVNRELRQLVADHGFAMVSKALGAITSTKMEEEVDMETLKENLQTEEEIVAEEEIEASLDEEEIEEEELELSVDEEEVEEEEEEEVIEEVLDEMDVRLSDEDEEIEEIDSVLLDSAEAEEEKDLDDEEEEEEELDIIDEESIEEEVEEELGIEPDLMAQFIPLARALLEVLSETEAEVPIEEQSEVEKTEEIEEAHDEFAALKAQVDDLGSQVAELTEILYSLIKPAQRMGKVKTDALPHESVKELEMEEEEETEDMMKSALRRYLKSPGRVVIRERQ